MTSPTTTARSGDDYLCEILSAEILSNIGQYLDLADRLKLRVVLPKKRCQFVEDMLQDDLSTLYVSPTRNSLTNFEQICRSEYYRDHVSNVVFVARALASVPEDAHCPSPKQYKCYIDRCGEFLSDWAALSSFCIYRDLITDNKLLEREGEEKRTLHMLCTGLGRLHRLNAVTLSREISSPGLNACSLWYSDAFTKHQIQKGHYSVRQDAAGQLAARACSKNDDRSSIIVLFAALQHANFSPEQLTLGPDMIKHLDSEMFHNNRFDMQSLARVFSGVTKLTVNSEELYGRHSMDIPQCIFASTSSRLQEIVLYDQSLPSSYPEVRQSITEQLFSYGKLPRLFTLRLHGDHHMPGMLDSTLFNKFMLKHRGIRTIEINDMLFSNGTKGENIFKTMESIFAFGRDKMSKQTKVTMHVHRRDEHDDGACTGQGQYECDGTCEQYRCHHDTWLHRSVLDDLAGELNVELVDGSWDFSKCFVEATRSHQTWLML